MAPKITDDNNNDSTSTSASTISTLTRNHPHPQTQLSSFPSASPISCVRRISRDNGCLENGEKRNMSHSRRRQISLNSLNSNSNINSNKNISNKSISNKNISRKNISNKSNNPQESLNGRHNEEDKKSTRAVIIGRELFIAFILITAGVFGSTFY
jgi:hypothetical protein